MTTDVNGNGERNVAFSVDVPDDIDASGPPYELVAKLKLVRPDGVGYQTNMVELHDVSEAHWLSYNDTPGCAALGDDCHCVLAQDMDGVGTLDFACMTRHGKGDIDELPWSGSEQLRGYNGDVCVVPGGEQSTPLGFVDSPAGTPAGARYSYAVRFLGGFQNVDSLRTAANFSGRRGFEELAWIGHGCYDNATANGYAPGSICPLTLPGVLSRIFQVPAPPAGPGNSYGACTVSSFDTVGFNDVCAGLHSQLWESATSFPCTMSIQQEMSLTCRDHLYQDGSHSRWVWSHRYATQPLEWAIDETSWPARFWATRDNAASQSRFWGGSANCVETDW